MKPEHYIISRIKYLTYVLVLFAMVTQSLSKTFDILLDYNHEIVIVDTEDVLDEQENLEIEDEKNEIQITWSPNYKYNYKSKKNKLYALLPDDYCSEIHIPPPKTVGYNSDL